MPRESRKTASGGLAPTVTSALIVCVAAALSLLGHIRLKADLNRLYTEIGQRDRQIAQWRRDNHKQQIDYEMLTSPKGLNNRLRDLRLDLVMPGDGARIVLPEPIADPAPPVHRVATERPSLAGDGRAAPNFTANGSEIRRR